MRALILAPFSRESLDRLAASGIDVVHESWLESGELQDPEQLGARIASEKFDTVVVEADFLFEETFAAAPGLRLAGICRSATNQVDVDAATAHGIAVINTPGRNAEAVAELTVALMLATARRIPETDRYIRERNWESPTAPYSSMRGVELNGKVAGIVGLGAIGLRVASLLNAFGMNVLGYDPFVSPSDANREHVTWTELDFMLESADFVTLHAPSPDDGSPLLTGDRIAKMKRGAILVNTASAELVDQDALVSALSSGRLRAAGLDIFPSHPVEPTNPLLDLPNVVLTPHIGGATDETIARHSAAITEDILRFAQGERPLNLVNEPVWEQINGSP